jgi:hypothetical protein
LHTPPRARARIVPPSPITVAIDDDNALPLGYGVLANVSESGACVWTDSTLDPGARLSLRISFAQPAEVHDVAATVVWGDLGQDHTGQRLHRYGLRWNDASSSCVLRLRRLALRAAGEYTTPSRGTGPVSRPPRPPEAGT